MRSSRTNRNQRPQTRGIFSVAVVVCGVLALLAALVTWESSDPLRYLVLLSIAVFSTRWKIAVAAVPGSVSLATVFILVGIAEFSLSEAIVMGCVAMMLEEPFSRHDRAGFSVTLFRLSSLAASIAVSHSVYLAAQPGAGEGRLWALVSAAVTFSFLNSFSAAIEAASQKDRRVVEIWHECGYWALPYYVIGGALAALISAVAETVGWFFVLPIAPVAYLSYRGVSRYVQHLRSRYSGTENLLSRHQRTLETLALAIAARFRTAGDQLHRTQVYALTIADDLGLPPDEREALRIASVLHDVGILAVPEQVMCKNGRLTAEEMEKVKVHPVVGASIVEQAEYPFPVAEIVRSHHERWDGRGYPDGLQGTEIPIGARILAVVNTLVALTSERADRPALPFDRALSLVMASSGTAFDPDVVNAVERHAAEFERFAAAAAPTVREADFVETISTARRESQAAYELAQAISHTQRLTELLRAVSERLRRAVSCDALAIYLRQDDHLACAHAFGAGRPLLEKLTFKLGEGVTGRAGATGRVLESLDPAKEFGSGYSPLLQSMLAVPLDGADGNVGVLTFYRRSRRPFGERDRQFLMNLRTVLASAIENAVRYEHAEASATTDYLTGLPNSRSLFERMEAEIARCRRAGEGFTVVVCDLDGFKHVNDRFGHLAGNQVLKAAADALLRNCREYDFVARMGGDEFVLLLTGLPWESVPAKLHRLSAVVTQAAAEVCPDAHVSLSAGAAYYPRDATNAEKLLALADSRMYQAKERRKLDRPRGFDFDWPVPAAVSPAEACPRC